MFRSFQLFCSEQLFRQILAEQPSGYVRQEGSGVGLVEGQVTGVGLGYGHVSGPGEVLSQGGGPL